MGGQSGRNAAGQSMILVDTSVWIDFFRGISSIYKIALHDLILKESDICLVDIILTEILQGIKEDRKFDEVKSHLLEFPIYSARDTDTFIQAAQIYRDCRKKGKVVKKTIDCVIASIAIENSLELFHNDKDFDLIKDCSKLRIFPFIQTA